MDLKQIEKLMSAMEHSKIKRIVIKREDFEIEIERECAAAAIMHTPATSYSLSSTPIESKPNTPQEISNPNEGKQNSSFVTSPMVGTFYSTPSPDEPPFVKLGDIISEEKVVCIIEAMKVMNEVKAGVKGKVVEVLVKNGEPVEFGTPILRVVPA